MGGGGGGSTPWSFARADDTQGDVPDSPARPIANSHINNSKPRQCYTLDGAVAMTHVPLGRSNVTRLSALLTGVGVRKGGRVPFPRNIVFVAIFKLADASPWLHGRQRCSPRLSLPFSSPHPHIDIARAPPVPLPPPSFPEGLAPGHHDRRASPVVLPSFRPFIAV